MRLDQEYGRSFWSTPTTPITPPYAAGYDAASPVVSGGRDHHGAAGDRVGNGLLDGVVAPLQHEADVDHIGAIVRRPRDPGRELATRRGSVRRDLDRQQLAAPADARPLPAVPRQRDLGDHRAVSDLVMDVV